jgi:hypothetical protein
MDIKYDVANARIVGWAQSTKGDLVTEIRTLGIRHSDKSKSPKAAERSLTVRTPKKDKLISRVSYAIPRHMIYVHKGVGRGTTIDQVGSTNRVAKPWFNPVIERKIDELADIVAEEIGSEIINKLLIR